MCHRNDGPAVSDELWRAVVLDGEDNVDTAENASKSHYSLMAN